MVQFFLEAFVGCYAGFLGVVCVCAGGGGGGGHDYGRAIVGGDVCAVGVDCPVGVWDEG